MHWKKKQLSFRLFSHFIYYCSFVGRWEQVKYLKKERKNILLDLFGENFIFRLMRAWENLFLWCIFSFWLGWYPGKYLNFEILEFFFDFLENFELSWKWWKIKKFEDKFTKNLVSYYPSRFSWFSLNFLKI